MAKLLFKKNGTYSFNDGSFVTLGNYIIKEPQEGTTVAAISPQKASETGRCLAIVDALGIWHGYDGEKTDIYGNTWIFDKTARSITIETHSGGSRTVTLDGSTYKQVAYLVYKPWNPTGQKIAFCTGSTISDDGGNDYYKSSLRSFDNMNDITADVLLTATTKFTNGVYVGGVSGWHLTTAEEFPQYFSCAWCQGGSSYIRYELPDYTLVTQSFYLDSIDGFVFSDPNTDPYGGGGSTSEGGGSGSFSRDTDPVDFPALPTFSASDTGFVTLFNPNITELKALAHFLWSDLIGASWEQTLNALKRVINDPMDAILSLHVVPVAVPNSGSKNVGIYDIISTVTMNYTDSQYIEVDCGSLNVSEYFGAYLDYSPYTKLEIYLPYIGIESLNIDEVMGKTIHVKYHVDILTGACVAYVKCGATILYQFSGSCAMPIPFNSVNYSNTITGILSAAASIGGAIATGGLTAPASVAGTAAVLAQGASNAAGSVMASKPTVKKSGTMGGSAGFMGVQTPFLILTQPKQAVAFAENQFYGYPAHITSALKDVSGYTECEKVFADGLSCSDREREEIISLLESGVII